MSSAISPDRVFPSPCERPAGIGWDGLWLWCSDPGSASVIAVDTAGGVRRRFRVAHLRDGLAYHRRTLWVLAGQPCELRLFTRNGDEIRRHETSWGAEATGIAVSQGLLFASRPGHIDSFTVSDLLLDGSLADSGSPGGVSVDATALWVTRPERGLVERIPRTTGTIRPFAVGGEPVGVARDRDGACWISDRSNRTLRRFPAFRYDL